MWPFKKTLSPCPVKIGDVVHIKGLPPEAVAKVVATYPKADRKSWGVDILWVNSHRHLELVWVDVEELDV